MNFIFFVLTGCISGWMIGKIVSGKNDIIVEIISCVAGGVLGGGLFSLLGVGGGWLIGLIVTVSVGVVIFIRIVRMIKGSV